VFTPLELGTVGLTEEEAVQMYGEEAVDSYAAEFEPLEWNLLHRHADAGVLCYIKVITNRLDGDRVIGMHIAAPNAGEIIQGFSLAFRKGITHKVYLFPTAIISDSFYSLEFSFLPSFLCCSQSHYSLILLFLLQDLLDTVGVHPTIAEQFTMLDVSKSSGQVVAQSSC
jgi:thioredoxin reductase (NADPH)